MNLMTLLLSILRASRFAVLVIVLLSSSRFQAAAQLEADFQLQTFRELDAEYGLPFVRHVWIVGTNRVGFLPPANWRISGTPERKRLTFQHESMKASMTITMLPPSAIPALPEPKEGENKTPQPGSAPTIQQWRMMAKEAFPDSKVEAEWESIASGARTITFDLLQFPEGVRQSIRLAYVFNGGVVYELLLRTGAVFSRYVGDFMAVLGTMDFAPDQQKR